MDQEVTVDTIATLIKEPTSPTDQLARLAEEDSAAGKILKDVDMELQRRFYHEMTDKFFEYLGNQGITEYHKVCFLLNVVGPSRSKISPMRFMQILEMICVTLAPQAALKIMELYDSDAEADRNASMIFQCVKAFHLMKADQLVESEKVIDAVESRIQTELGFEIVVCSEFHKAASHLAMAKQDFTKLYRHALLYLTYTSQNDLSEDMRVKWAVDLILAALIAQNQYNFGEVLQMDVVNSVKSREQEWALQLINAVNDGDHALTAQIIEQFKVPISKSHLASHLDVIRGKLPILALLDLSFKKPNGSDLISFSKIAEHCHLSLDQVEFCLMRAMSLELIRGQIDQVNETLNLTWVRPRMLDRSRLELMEKRFLEWHKTTQSLHEALQSQTAELIVA